ncbi:AAA family ATPase [Pantanalinema sp. GBBB05]|uniref:AAA family ATPase n=1 Tax=Pantanalinema sp. GBBB05 TaxID=2604139 RepID=UPI001D50C2F2|nr:SMC family ATPase [Pantanalinema sp. GBBB05]
MEILTVTLKNFKSHSDRHFTFQPGTNAICGENGAGKTSLLEAIAWTLFNYRGSYKNEDLIRNGASSAQVRISFVSNRDQRTYEISRCTRSGYTIYDPQVGEKLEYNRIEEEVLPWLRQHLGVAAGTDLADLFANTIGVPQGMFTVDFLKPDRERKKTFDTILKVDEYRRVFDQFLSLTKYAEAHVKELEREIERYDDELTGFEHLAQKRQAQQQEITEVQQSIQQLQTQLVELEQTQANLAVQAQQMQQVQSQLDLLTVQQQTQAESMQRLQKDVHQAEEAAAVCTTHREAYQLYEQAETALQSLQTQWQAEQKLHQEKRYCEQQLSDRQVQLNTLLAQLEDLKTAEAEIQRLEPLAQQQLQLEQEQQVIRQHLQHCVSWKQTVKTQEKQLQQRQTNLAQLQRDITRIQSLAATVQQIPQFEQEQQRCQLHLSRIAAAIQFEADLQQLLDRSQSAGDRYLNQVEQTTTSLKALQVAVPIWSETLETAIAALQQGVDWQAHLVTALRDILNDLADQTSVETLEQNLQAVQTQLRIARRQQTEFANLDSLQQRHQELTLEIAELQTGINDIKARLVTEADLLTQQTDLADGLLALNDPRGQIRLLRQRLQQQTSLETQVQEAQVALQAIQQTIAQVDLQLAALPNLIEEMQAQQAVKAEHQAAHENYLAYRELANTRRDRRQQLQAASEQLQVFTEAQQRLIEEREHLRQTFDPVQFQQVQSNYQVFHNQSIALNARLPDMVKVREQLDQQVARLETLQTKRQQAEVALKQKRKIQHFIKFAREAYKKAGPRITERYVQRISQEADRLFRELLNRLNVSLIWTRDYEILVQEGGHTRRFINLSGGEQMCAALAVRLALLKVLADIDIAFFDEPTTNMDRPRREQLAEAIANIKTFRQLFVISHDDTFEKVTENVIFVQREEAVY